VTMIRGDGGRAAVMRAVLRDLARNPLLIAVGLGIGANVLNIAPIPVVSDMAKILGAAALPIMLLCVGANIRIRAMTSAGLPVLLSVVGKMVVFPAMILVAAQFVDLSDAALLVLILYGAVPTAASAYTLARQMGGNAPVMATIITLQTAISFVTLPITVTLVQWLGAK
ncbi:MAG: AEC family transporter, partial [Caldilinea sp.]|nr:AEC family transporter [Caldilinea sp.]